MNTIGSVKNAEGRKQMIEEVLSADTLRFGYSALSIVIDAKQTEPRGKMTGRSITLSPYVARDSEFIKLLAHEIGHYVDIYYLIPNGGNDLSNLFYSISWQDKTVKKSGEGLSSFVSGYAATNQFEDFAESFVFYMFHNDEFADRALRNDSLRQKYLFFSEHVFIHREFVGTDFRTQTIPSYVWDTTKIPISVKKYLNSLE